MKISVLGCWGVGTIGETTSFVVDIPGATVLLDVGLSPARQLKQIGRVLPEVTHCLITHVHADHLQGLPYALFVRAVQERAYGKVEPIKVISHRSGLATAKELCQLLYPERPLTANWVEMHSGESIALSADATVRALAVNHTVECYAYRIDSGSKSVTISGDTLPTDELVDFAMNSTLLIQESFGTERDFSGPASSLKHCLAIDAGQIAQKAMAGNLMLFHMHERYFESANKELMIAEVRKAYDGNIIFPQDLMQFEL